MLSESRNGARIRAATPTGTLTKKIHSQERKSTRMPPNRTPNAAPTPPTAPQAPSAMLRSRPSLNVQTRIESAAGVIVAAPSPWSARKPISDASLQASPHRSEPRVKSERADHEDTPAAEKVRGPSSQEEEAAEHERVGADHPLQVLLREPEVDLDGRQRDVDDRDVEDGHELHREDERECEPLLLVRVDHGNPRFQPRGISCAE